MNKKFRPVSDDEFIRNYVPNSKGLEGARQVGDEEFIRNYVPGAQLEPQLDEVEAFVRKLPTGPESNSYNYVLDPLVSLGQAVSNIGASVGSGALAAASGVTNAFIDDDADKVDFNRSAYEAGFRPDKLNEWWDDLYSSGTKAQRAEVAAAMETNNPAKVVGAYLTNPAAVVTDVVGAIPYMVPAFRFASAAGKLGAASAAARQLVGKEAEKYIARRALAGSYAGEALTTTGTLSQDVGMENLRNGDHYNKGQGYALLGGLASAAVSLVNPMEARIATRNLMTRKALEEGAQVPLLKRKGVKGAAARFGMDVFKEGVLEEAPQSAIEEIATNLATDKPWNEGVAAAMTQGALIGGAMGGMMHPFTGGTREAVNNASDTAIPLLPPPTQRTAPQGNLPQLPPPPQGSSGGTPSGTPPQAPQGGSPSPSPSPEDQAAVSAAAMSPASPVKQAIPTQQEPNLSGLSPEDRRAYLEAKARREQRARNAERYGEEFDLRFGEDFALNTSGMDDKLRDFNHQIYQVLDAMGYGPKDKRRKELLQKINTKLQDAGGDAAQAAQNLRALGESLEETAKDKAELQRAETFQQMADVMEGGELMSFQMRRDAKKQRVEQARIAQEEQERAAREAEAQRVKAEQDKLDEEEAQRRQAEEQVRAQKAAEHAQEKDSFVETMKTLPAVPTISKMKQQFKDLTDDDLRAVGLAQIDRIAAQVDSVKDTNVKNLIKNHLSTAKNIMGKAFKGQGMGMAYSRLAQAENTLNRANEQERKQAESQAKRKAKEEEKNRLAAEKKQKAKDAAEQANRLAAEKKQKAEEEAEAQRKENDRAALAKRNQELSAQNTRLQKQADDAIAEIKAALEQETRSRKAAETSAKEQAEKSKTDLAQARKDSEAELRRLKKENAEEIKRINTAHKVETRALKSEHKDEIKRLKEAQKEEKKQINEAHSEEVKRVRTAGRTRVENQAKKAADQQGKLKEKIKSANQKTADTELARKAQNEENLKALRELRGALTEMKKSITESATKLRVSENEKKQLQARLDKLKASNEKDTEAHQKKVAALEDKLKEAKQRNEEEKKKFAELIDKAGIAKEEAVKIAVAKTKKEMEKEVNRAIADKNRELREEKTRSEEALKQKDQEIADERKKAKESAQEKDTQIKTLTKQAEKAKAEADKELGRLNREIATRDAQLDRIAQANAAAARAREEAKAQEAAKEETKPVETMPAVRDNTIEDFSSSPKVPTFEESEDFISYVNDPEKVAKSKKPDTYRRAIIAQLSRLKAAGKADARQEHTVYGILNNGHRGWDDRFRAALSKLREFEDPTLTRGKMVPEDSLARAGKDMVEREIKTFLANPVEYMKGRKKLADLELKLLKAQYDTMLSATNKKFAPSAQEKHAWAQSWLALDIAGARAVYDNYLARQRARNYETIVKNLNEDAEGREEFLTAIGKKDWQRAVHMAEEVMGLTPSMLNGTVKTARIFNTTENPTGEIEVAPEAGQEDAVSYNSDPATIVEQQEADAADLSKQEGDTGEDEIELPPPAEPIPDRAIKTAEMMLDVPDAPKNIAEGMKKVLSNNNEDEIIKIDPSQLYAIVEVAKQRGLKPLANTASSFILRQNALKEAKQKEEEAEKQRRAEQSKIKTFAMEVLHDMENYVKYATDGRELTKYKVNRVRKLYEQDKLKPYDRAVFEQYQALLDEAAKDPEGFKKRRAEQKRRSIKERYKKEFGIVRVALELKRPNKDASFSHHLVSKLNEEENFLNEDEVEVLRKYKELAEAYGRELSVAEEKAVRAAFPTMTRYMEKKAKRVPSEKTLDDIQYLIDHGRLAADDTHIFNRFKEVRANREAAEEKKLKETNARVITGEEAANYKVKKSVPKKKVDFSDKLKPKEIVDSGILPDENSKTVKSFDEPTSAVFERVYGVSIEQALNDAEKRVEELTLTLSMSSVLEQADVVKLGKDLQQMQSISNKFSDASPKEKARAETNRLLIGNLLAEHFKRDYDPPKNMTPEKTSDGKVHYSFEQMFHGALGDDVARIFACALAVNDASGVHYEYKGLGRAGDFLTFNQADNCEGVACGFATKTSGGIKRPLIAIRAGGKDPVAAAVHEMAHTGDFMSESTKDPVSSRAARGDSLIGEVSDALIEETKDGGVRIKSFPEGSSAIKYVLDKLRAGDERFTEGFEYALIGTPQLSKEKAESALNKSLDNGLTDEDRGHLADYIRTRVCEEFHAELYRFLICDKINKHIVETDAAHDVPGAQEFLNYFKEAEKSHAKSQREYSKTASKYAKSGRTTTPPAYVVPFERAGSDDANANEQGGNAKATRGTVRGDGSNLTQDKTVPPSGKVNDKKRTHRTEEEIRAAMRAKLTPEQYGDWLYERLRRQAERKKKQEQVKKEKELIGRVDYLNRKAVEADVKAVKTQGPVNFLREKVKDRGLFWNSLVDTIDYAGKGLNTLKFKLITFTNDLVNDLVPYIGDVAKDYYQEQIDHMQTKGKHMATVKAIYDAAAEFDKETRKKVNEFIKESTETGFWGYVPKDYRNGEGNPYDDGAFPVSETLRAQYDALDKKAQAVIQAVFKHGHDTWLQKRRLFDKNGVAMQGSEYSSPFHELKTVKPYAPLRRTGQYNFVWESDKLKEARGKLLAYRQAINEVMERNETLPDDAQEEVPEAILEGRKIAQEEVDKLERDADHYYVARFESYFDAMKTQRDFNANRKNGKSRVYDLANSKDLYSLTSMANVNEIVSRLDSAFEKTFDRAVSTAMRNAMAEMVMESAQKKIDSSMRHRRVIAGADADMLGSFLHQGQTDAWLIANMEHGKKISDAMQLVRDKAEEFRRYGNTTEVNKCESLVNELGHRHNRLMTRTTHDTADAAIDWARTATTALTLSFNPMFYVQNALQPYMMTAPILAGEFGAESTSKQMGVAYKEWAGMFKEALKGAKGWSGKYHAIGDLTSQLDNIKDESEKAMLKDMERRNLLDLGSQQEFGNVAGNSWGAKVANKVMVELSTAARGVEILNRYVSAISAFRLMKSKLIADGVSEAEANKTATEYARHVLSSSQGDYSGINAPDWFNTKLGKLALQFRKFQAIQINFFLDMVKGSFANAKTEEDKMARAVFKQQVKWALATHFAFAGLKGLPGASLLISALAYAFGDDDDEDDSLVRKMFTSVNVPMPLQDLALEGIPSALQWNISDSVGAGTMLSIAPYRRKELFDAEGLREGLFALGGAALGRLERIWKAQSDARKWDTFRPLAEAVMPKGIPGMLKAFDIIDMTYDKKGDKVLDDSEFGLWSRFIAAMGGQPKALEKMYKARNAAYKIQESSNDESSSIKRRWAIAREKRDYKAQAEIRNELRELNKKRSKQGLPRITADQLNQAYKKRVKDQAFTVKHHGVAGNANKERLIKRLNEIYMDD